WLASGSVNQRLPSGPAEMDEGELLVVPTLNVVTLPLRLIRSMTSPITAPVWGSNRGPEAQMLPSGPVVIAWGTLSATWSLKAPVGVIIASMPSCANQMLPSGPAVMPPALPDTPGGTGIMNSVIWPFGVIRPTFSPVG